MTDTAPGLFPDPTPPPPEGGPTTDAMAASIEQWRSLGRLLSPIQVQALMDQALACDRARASGKATAMSGAMAVLATLLDKFKLAAIADPPPADDSWNRFLDAVNADASAPAVRSAAALALEPGPDLGL